MEVRVTDLALTCKHLLIPDSDLERLSSLCEGAGYRGHRLMSALLRMAASNPPLHGVDAVIKALPRFIFDIEQERDPYTDPIRTVSESHLVY